MIATAVMACAAATGALLVAERRGDQRLKWVAKPAASLAFIAFAVQSGALESDYGRLVLTGLTFCLAGDVLLIPKAKNAFLAGMAAFALGHLAYIGAFAAIWAAFSWLAVIAALAMAALALFMLRWLWPHLGAFRIPVAVYCLIISVMVATSFATAAPGGGSPYWLVSIGAVAFAISDIAVARDQFVKPEFFNRAWGLPLYYGAQLLLAASVSLYGSGRLV